jgi:hypothetical protein
MGAVADAVSDVVDTVSDAVSDVGDFVQDTGQAVIDEVVTPVVTAVQKTYDAFEEDPLGTSLKIAAAASGNPMYVMAANTAVAVAHGADLNDALESGAKAGATSWAANAIAEYVSTPEVGSVRGPDNIDVGGGFNPATGAASPTVPIPPKITTEGKIAGNTAANIIRGQDPLTALMNGGISASVPSITSQIPGYDDLSKAQQSIVNNTVSTALRGGDPSQALVDSALMAGINEAKAQYKASQPSGALPTTTVEVPGGTQVASTDGALPRVEMSGSPIYAESSSANSVKAPFGYDLMPASMADQKPEGAYYDQFQNAWFMPNQDAQNLQAQLQTPVAEVVTPTETETTTADTGALPTIDLTPKAVATNAGALPATPTAETGNLVNETGQITDFARNKETNELYKPLGTNEYGGNYVPVLGSQGYVPDVVPTVTTPTVATTESASSGALPVTTTEVPVTTAEVPMTEMPEMVITAPRDPYTGDIQLDLSGQPTTTAATPVATPTATASTASVGTSAPVSGLSTITTGGSNLGQTTSATPSLGALPTAPNPTMLAAAPLEKQNMILGELTNLYPQLSNIDPRLLQILSGKAKPASYYNYGAGSGGSTPLMNASTGAASSSGMPFKTTGTASNTAGLTSSTGSGALSRAGLSMLDSNQTISGFTKGGLAEHNPEFITGATGHHVKGEGDGQSDSIPAMLADGEYVFDADTVAALGNGSNDAGARILDKMRQNLRKHKRSAPAGKIPPKAKSPLEYMKG